VRQSLATPANGVRYQLTPYGRTLQPVFNALWLWGSRHLVRRGAAGGTLVMAPKVRTTLSLTER
jgi:DNA-binding HxlR family transcriptional regulator